MNFLHRRIVLESTALVELNWSSQTIGLIGTYAVGQFIFYCLAALVIKLSSVTAFNLSILSADFYALIVGIQLFQYKVKAT